MGINIEKTTNINDENITLKQLLDKVTTLEGKVSTLESSVEYLDTYNKGVRTWRFTAWPSSSNHKLKTNLTVNASSGGRTYLLLISGHAGIGNATFSSVYMLRCGYSDNYLSSTRLSTQSGTMSDTLSFTVSDDGYLEVNWTWNSGCVSGAFIYNYYQ